VLILKRPDTSHIFFRLDVLPLGEIYGSLFYYSHCIITLCIETSRGKEVLSFNAQGNGAMFKKKLWECRHTKW